MQTRGATEHSPSTRFAAAALALPAASSASPPPPRSKAQGSWAADRRRDRRLTGCRHCALNRSITPEKSRGGPLRTAAALGAALLALATLSALASAEVSQRDGVRVSVKGKMTPSRLPRAGAAPIAVSVAGRIGATSPAGPPQLQTQIRE